MCLRSESRQAQQACVCRQRRPTHHGGLVLHITSGEHLLNRLVGVQLAIVELASVELASGCVSLQIHAGTCTRSGPKPLPASSTSRTKHGGKEGEELSDTAGTICSAESWVVMQTTHGGMMLLVTHPDPGAGAGRCRLLHGKAHAHVSTHHRPAPCAHSTRHGTRICMHHKTMQCAFSTRVARHALPSWRGAPAGSRDRICASSTEDLC